MTRRHHFEDLLPISIMESDIKTADRMRNCGAGGLITKAFTVMVELQIPLT